MKVDGRREVADPICAKDEDPLPSLKAVMLRARCLPIHVFKVVAVLAPHDQLKRSGAKCVPTVVAGIRGARTLNSNNDMLRGLRPVL
eukprot:3526360-Prymnesium_polylepis.1